MSEDKALEAEKEEAKQEEHPGLEGLDDRTKEEIIKLRRESAERRVRAKELQEELEKYKTENDKARQAKMEEDGKLKELLAEKEREIAELSKAREEKLKYDNIFSEQLEEALRKLTPTLAEVVANSGYSMADKVKYANKLSAEMAITKKESPDSARPGGEGEVPKDINLSEYSGKDGRLRLAQLQTTNPKLFELITKMKQNL